LDRKATKAQREYESPGYARANGETGPILMAPRAHGGSGPRSVRSGYRWRLSEEEVLMGSVLKRARVLVALIVVLLSLIAFAGPVAAHLPLPDAACNQGTERAFWDIGASLAVPMDGTDFGEPFCMTMPDLVRH
jgi:hypothetical protein